MKTILLVEDNEMNRDMLSRRLTRYGFNIIYAMNGEESIEASRTHRPDIILMDMSLPIMDGWEATSRIKNDAELKNIPIIGLSAHAMANEREKAISAGCDDYETKPVDFESLCNKISTFLD